MMVKFLLYCVWMFRNKVSKNNFQLERPSQECSMEKMLKKVMEIFFHIIVYDYKKTVKILVTFAIGIISRKVILMNV